MAALYYFLVFFSLIAKTSKFFFDYTAEEQNDSKSLLSEDEFLKIVEQTCKVLMPLNNDKRAALAPARLLNMKLNCLPTYSPLQCSQADYEKALPCVEKIKNSVCVESTAGEADSKCIKMLCKSKQISKDCTKRCKFDATSNAYDLFSYVN
uniref:Domain of unknown function DB domain-containing protein n=1 Tax=Ditylenchus dipsaci TaxID=166011 RepID=A0A915EUF2_9BILA